MVAVLGKDFANADRGLAGFGTLLRIFDDYLLRQSRTMSYLQKNLIPHGHGATGPDEVKDHYYKSVFRSSKS